jgi:hypothetical protein
LAERAIVPRSSWLTPDKSANRTCGYWDLARNPVIGFSKAFDANGLL